MKRLIFICFLFCLILVGCSKVEEHSDKQVDKNSALEVTSSETIVTEASEEIITTEVKTSETETTEEKITSEVTTETSTEVITTQEVTTEVVTTEELPKPDLEIEKDDSTIYVNYGDLTIKFPKSVKLSNIDFSENGNSYGSLKIPTASIDTDIIKGASQSLVDNYDVCISTDYSFCGSPKPVLLCGHKTKSFSKLYDIKVGDYIFIKTSYGGYVYEVTKTQVGTVTSDCTNILDDNGKNIIVENKKYKTQPLQIYTCYGQDRGTQRFIVNAKWVTGTKVK